MLITMLLLVLLEHLSEHVEDGGVTMSETFLFWLESLDFSTDRHEHVGFCTFSELEEGVIVGKSSLDDFSNISKEVLDHSVFSN